MDITNNRICDIHNSGLVCILPLATLILIQMEDISSKINQSYPTNSHVPFSFSFTITSFFHIYFPFRTFYKVDTLLTSQQPTIAKASSSLPFCFYKARLSSSIWCIESPKMLPCLVLKKNMFKQTFLFQGFENICVMLIMYSMHHCRWIC